MTMKATRHAKILELIQNHTVTTQEELQSLLEANGFYATQATISRDIRDLRLVKVLSPSGIYYYTKPVGPKDSTANLLKDPITQPNAPEGCHLEVTVLAESIQAAPSTAVEGAWAVTVVNGALTSAIPTA